MPTFDADIVAFRAGVFAPAEITVHTDARLRPIHLHKLVIDFKLTAPSRLYWAGRPAMRIVQALHWIHDMLAADGDRSLRKSDKSWKTQNRERRFATIFAVDSTLSPRGCVISSAGSFMTRISLARPTARARYPPLMRFCPSPPMVPRGPYDESRLFGVP